MDDMTDEVSEWRVTGERIAREVCERGALHHRNDAGLILSWAVDDIAKVIASTDGRNHAKNAARFVVSAYVEKARDEQMTAERATDLRRSRIEGTDPLGWTREMFAEEYLRVETLWGDDDGEAEEAEGRMTRAVTRCTAYGHPDARNIALAALGV